MCFALRLVGPSIFLELARLRRETSWQLTWRFERLSRITMLSQATLCDFTASARSHGTVTTDLRLGSS
jgi:hypothetical protein